MRNFWLAALTMLVACSSETLPPPDVHLLVGQEDDTWSADPAPTRVQVEFVEDTRRTVIGESNAPASVITIRSPSIAPGTIASFEATGVDAAGTPLVHGSSVTYVIYDLTSRTIPIFVARTAAWSRPPESLQHARNYPVAIVGVYQYVIVAGGDVKDVSPAVPDFYDAINWRSGAQNQAPFPCAPKNMVMVGTKLICIEETGANSIDLNLADPPVVAVPAPAGLMFSEVTGGDVLELSDGSQFIVGATRASGDPTAKVLRIDPYGTLRALTLATPRRGAAAGVIGGKLVVWGGSAEGVGAEVLNKTLDAFTPLPFAPDATVGLGVGTFDGTTALLAGGKDPTTGAAAPLRTFDVTCATDCATSELAMVPTALQRTHVFPLAAGNLLLTGDSDDGEFHAYSLLTASGTPEIVERPLRERRKAATALLLPNGQPGVLGGENPDTADPVLSIETFFF